MESENEFMIVIEVYRVLMITIESRYEMNATGRTEIFGRILSVKEAIIILHKNSFTARAFYNVRNKFSYCDYACQPIHLFVLPLHRRRHRNLRTYHHSLSHGQGLAQMFY